MCKNIGTWQYWNILIVLVMLRGVLCWFETTILCVSCPSANEFLAILFYFLPDQAQTHIDHWKVLNELCCQISFKSGNVYRISPSTPILNIARFRQRYNVLTESGQFLQLGSMGKFFTRCRIWIKFGTRVRPKPSNDQGEFELDRARSKIISPKICLH